MGGGAGLIQWHLFGDRRVGLAPPISRRANELAIWWITFAKLFGSLTSKRPPTLALGRRANPSGLGSRGGASA